MRGSRPASPLDPDGDLHPALFAGTKPIPSSTNMALTESGFKERMDKLNSSQQSIENTSSWFSLFRADARTIVGFWETYFTKADQQKRLSMIYLASDVLQTR